MQKILPDASDKEFLRACYRTVLARTPDQDGERHHLAALTKGTRREDLLCEFVRSGEFIDRLSAGHPDADRAAERQFVPAGHFYSPLPAPDHCTSRYAAQVLVDVDADFVNEGQQLELAEVFKAYYQELPFPTDAADDCRYYLDNGSFNYFDGIILYCFIRHLKPKAIIEVGSGFSSALMLDSCERFLPGKTEMTFVDPFPSALLRLLRPADRNACRILDVPVQDVPLDTFRALARGDILFIDSSHVSKFGSDVNHLIFNVLPVLADGVAIHFHDIFRNFDYPKEWLTEGRAWNEAYLLRAFLEGNANYRIMFFNDWFADRHWNTLVEHMPLCTVQPAGSPFKNCGVSLWLEKV